MKTENSIVIRTQEEIEILREAGNILASVISDLNCSLKSGVTTRLIDQKAEEIIGDYKVTPAFKGYRGFPNCFCISVNNEIVHGIPSDRVIRDGDIVSLDGGIIHKGYFSDTAFTIGIGSIEPKLQKLIDVAKESLSRGIAQAKVGNHLSDISAAIQQYVESNHMAVVRDFVGHGIGQKLHEEPEIPNFGPPHCGPILKEGMVFAIEPMVNLGTWKTGILDDGWTVVTADGQPSAHFEHTVALKETGPEILTKKYG